MIPWQLFHLTLILLIKVSTINDPGRGKGLKLKEKTSNALKTSKSPPLGKINLPSPYAGKITKSASWKRKNIINTSLRKK